MTQRARSLEIRENLLPKEHPNVAVSLSNLGLLYQATGQYSKAETLYQRALEIVWKRLPSNHPLVASALNNMARLYQDKNEIEKAEPLFQRALEIRETELPSKPLDVAASLGNLAGLYQATGQVEKAEPLFQRALAMFEKESPASHPLVATALNNLAGFYERIGKPEKAVPLLQRALEICESSLPPKHPDLAISLSNLAGSYIETRKYEKAEPLFQRALQILEYTANSDNLPIATVLNGQALLYLATGKYHKAEPLFQRALTIREKVLGPNHPDVAISLTNLAGLYQATNDCTRALAFRSRATEIEEHNIGLFLASGSEHQKQGFLNLQLGSTSFDVSLHLCVEPADLESVQLALTTILRRKGRTLDAMSDQIGALRRRANPQDVALLNQLIVTRTQLANLQLSGAGGFSLAQRQEVTRLEAEAEQREGEIGHRSAEFRAQAQPVTRGRVQQAIPIATALIELFSYHPFNAKKLQAEAARYVVYVLQDMGEPMFVDLGEASPIDADVERLRGALKDRKRTDVQTVARALDERVMRPVRKLLGPTRHIFLSPDGALNLIPFAALVDENGKYLVENYSLSYLTSGRDLLRLQAQTESHSAPVLIANPLFDLATSRRPGLSNGQVNQPPMQPSAKRRSLDFTLKSYDPLPGTAGEAAALAKLLPQGTQVLLQDRATEAALKQVNRPRVLHIATHGFFLPDQPQALPVGNRLLRETFDTLDLSPLPARWENPLLRSGLVLAGVKQGQSGAGEDGVLTALEVAGLDLWGTKLVVLSACETGLGDVRNGVGVYGLRRALVLAGSETQIMSLWKVSDSGTRDLMTAYYTRLQAGEGRSEALRQVQLAMLRGQLMTATSARAGKRGTADTADTVAARDYRHPYYWAAFIQSGDWRNMDGKEVQPQ